MTDNTITTALTVYVPREQALPGKFKILLKKTDCILHRYFLRNKRLFCVLLFSYALLFSFFTAVGKLNLQIPFVFSVYFSNEFYMKFGLLTILASFLSCIPVLGRAVVCLYCTCVIFAITAFTCTSSLFVQSGIFDILPCVAISSVIIFFTIVITVVLLENYRYKYASSREYIKGYYFRIFIVLLISTINYFLFTLLIKI